MRLDPKNPLPLHVQLKQEIEKQINYGKYSEQIPSERELMEEYSVSRSTVRQAISQLVQEGILEKRHGKGTFISMKPIQDWLGSLSSTTEIVSRMGMTPGAKLITHGVVPTPDNIKPFTEMSEVYYIKRIRFADDTPLSIERHYYPVEIGKKMIHYDIDKGTLYDILEKDLHINLQDAEQVITSGHLSKEDARLLEVSETFSVLGTERMLYDHEGTLIEYFIASYRSDLYSFRIKLSRKFN